MSSFYISICIFLLLGGSAVLMLSSNVKWWVKVVVSVALISAGVLSYRAVNSVEGKPVLMQDNIKDVLILGYWPDKNNNVMYIWVKKPDQVDPVNHKVPYSEKLHRQLQNGRKANRGKPYRGNINGSNNPLNRFSDTVEDVELETLPSFPPKN